MASFDFVTFAAVFLAVGGLAAVLWEILVKNPRSLVEMMIDSRRFAEASLAGEDNPPARRSADTSRVAANQNRPRLAA
ncbi:MAG TPA: hypothetical protein VJV39_17075 [Dongiaceae bacterium]|nr:hypothetical protein [Dongiaceae bacterium]